MPDCLKFNNLSFDLYLATFDIMYVVRCTYFSPIYEKNCKSQLNQKDFLNLK